MNGRATQNDRRPRRVTRQREAGEATRRETRRRVLAAAAAEFAERGYARPTVARIADPEDVEVPTRYSAWEVNERCCAVAWRWPSPGREQVRPGIRPQQDRGLGDHSPTDGVTFMSFMAHGYRVLAERSAVGWTTYRGAAAVDKDIATTGSTAGRRLPVR